MSPSLHSCTACTQFGWRWGLVLGCGEWGAGGVAWGVGCCSAKWRLVCCWWCGDWGHRHHPQHPGLQDGSFQLPGRQTPPMLARGSVGVGRRSGEEPGTQMSPVEGTG
eukprot:2071564-Prorocentrum_lima.AAC.1